MKGAGFSPQMKAEEYAGFSKFTFGVELF